MKLNSVVFYTSDIERIIEFYTKVLVLDLGFRDGDKFVSFNFDNGVSLGIKSKADEREIPGYQALIISVENLDEKYKELKSQNIYENIKQHDWGKHFSILDPDGNKVEFIEKK